VFHRLPRLAIVAALACSIGLHWGFLQSVAWVGMVVSYSQDATIGEALGKTFNGKHPCPLCKAIAKGKRAAKQCEFPLAGKKLVFSHSPMPIVFAAPSTCWEAGWPDGSPSSLTLTPRLSLLPDRSSDNQVLSFARRSRAVGV
jgi:hypothetical protein